MKRRVLLIMTLLFSLIFTGCGAFQTKESEFIPESDKVDVIKVKIEDNTELDSMESKNAIEEQEHIEELLERGAVPLKMIQEAYECTSSLSNEELEVLKEKGEVSDFGAHIIYDNTVEDGYIHFNGYTITTYVLEDGTQVTPVEDEFMKFVSANGNMYDIGLLSFDSESGESLTLVIPSENMPIEDE